MFMAVRLRWAIPSVAVALALSSHCCTNWSGAMVATDSRRCVSAWGRGLRRLLRGYKDELYRVTRLVTLYNSSLYPLTLMRLTMECCQGLVRVRRGIANPPDLCCAGNNRECTIFNRIRYGRARDDTLLRPVPVDKRITSLQDASRPDIVLRYRTYCKKRFPLSNSDRCPSLPIPVFNKRPVPIT